MKKQFIASVIETAARPARLGGVVQAFQRALVSQCHPAMLFAVLLPFLIAMAGALLLLWLCWTPLTEWLRVETAQWQMVN